MILKKKKKGKKKNVVKITVIDEEAVAAQQSAASAQTEVSDTSKTKKELAAPRPESPNMDSARQSRRSSIFKKAKDKVLDEIDNLSQQEDDKSLDDKEQINEEELAQAAKELEENKATKGRKGRKASKKSKKLSKQEEKLAASIVNLTDKLSALEESEEVLPPQPKPRIYKKIALFFSLFVVVLVGIIAYYSLVSVDIVIVPAQEQVSNNLIIDVYNQEIAKNNFSDTAIGGIVKTIPIEETKTYEASGEKMLSENVVGRVTIINNYIKNQPLVATTRLLTPDEKLFRIKRTVNVPAGGSVEVEVYADKPGPDMVIGPTRFTIPGLWIGLQDKIYAVSKEKMHYERKVKKYITQVDIDDAVADLKKSLQTKLSQTAKEQYSNYDVVLFAIDDNTIAQEVYGKVDEEKDEFSMTMSAKAVVVAFNKKDALKIVKKKFSTKIGGDKKEITFNDQTVTYSLNDYAVDRDTASVNITFDARLALKDNTQIVDPNMLVGLSKRQLEEFLRAQENIAGFEIYFHPSFIKKVPSLVDRIHIEVK